MAKKRRIILLVGVSVILLAALLWFPYSSRSIPEWRLTVVDSSGHVVSDVQATEEWLNPIEDGLTSSDSRKTNANGEVIFPRRPLNNRLLFGNFKKHPSAHVFVCWKDEFGDVFWDEANPTLSPRLVLRKADCAYG